VTKPSASIPTCPGSSYLSAKITFPGCWDGKNLDSPDHRSHMAYPVRGPARSHTRSACRR
jgi:hypothetical protein